MTPAKKRTTKKRADAAALLDEVYEFIGEYVIFPTTEAHVSVALWAAHSHTYDCFESTPRLSLLSPEPESGKTRTLEVLDLLVAAPWQILSSSPAAIFRTLKKESQTLLFDEVDTVFGNQGKNDTNEDLRALLNAGHRRGATVPRCVGPQHNVEKFPVFAPAALAGLGDLPDTIMGRSVIVRMRKRSSHETVKSFRIREAEPVGHALRDRLADWADAVRDELIAARPEMPPGVEDRPADVWEPLLAIADAAGGHWPETARAACSEMVKVTADRSASLGRRLLADLRTIFGDAPELTTKMILHKLVALDESPWGNLKGKPLDDRGLAWRLSHYEVKSTKVYVKTRDGSTKAQGYRATDLWDAWERYVPEEVTTQPDFFSQPSPLSPASPPERT